jgi:glutathione peroxidase
MAMTAAACDDTDGNGGTTKETRQNRPQVSSALDVSVKDATGATVRLADRYNGKVVLIVNVASRCGFTPQYEGLEKLHKTYADKGLAIAAFPCNQFRGQEPGSIGEIVEFCQSKYGVTFDIYDKIEVNGDSADPLYAYLTGPEAPIDDKGPVKWNFEKFLIGRDGKLIARYRSRTTPQQIEADIQAAL